MRFRSHPLTAIARLLAVLLACAGAGPAAAQRDATAQAFDRFEEALAPAVEEGSLAPQGIGPILLVGATPAFEETRAWFPAAALDALTRVFGAGNVRLCEACMSPRVRVEPGRLEHSSVLTLPEIARVDAELRGDGPPARSAIWFEETPGGVAVRLVDLGSGQVLYAGNLDGSQRERRETAARYNATLELGRRLRGQSLTHVLADVALLPNQHLSLDVVEQFGPDNLNLAGVSMSLLDPTLGVGIAYYRIIPVAFNLTVGAQAMVSLPTMFVSMIAPEDANPDDILEPLLTGVLVARMPIPSTNFAVTVMASTNLRLAVGFSLLNTQLLPFLP